MRVYRTTGRQDPAIEIGTGPDPRPAANEVVLSVQAASLNYRDLLQAKGAAGLVPLSDGAGIISSVGEGVTAWREGDRVVAGFMPGWVEGEFSAAKQASALGGAGVDGMLAEQVALPACALVRIPDAMTFEQAATLPCAGVTAWAALFERRPIQPGETVLLLGTGGLSIFALQLAKAAGARVIVTSSSDEKLARAAALGADHGINYTTSPDWAAEALRLTGGVGADLAVDVGGPGTLNETLKATRHGGRISLMGVLTGFAGPIDTAAILSRRITLQGIYVGSVAMLEALSRIPVEPVIDRVFAFDEAAQAYEAMRGAGHFGKLVVRVGG